MAILELAQVKLQVLLRNPNVSPVDPALHVRPERFNRVRVHIAGTKRATIRETGALSVCGRDGRFQEFDRRPGASEARGNDPSRSFL